MEKQEELNVSNMKELETTLHGELIDASVNGMIPVGEAFSIAMVFIKFVFVSGTKAVEKVKEDKPTA